VTEAIYDFTGKLRQPSLREHLSAYLSWRRDLRSARASGRPDPEPPAIAPISINLDLTTACNYRCDHCIDWDILNTKHRHDEETLRSSIITMVGRGLRSVILIGGGEPTIYPGFSDFVSPSRSLARIFSKSAVLSGLIATVQRAVSPSNVSFWASCARA